MYNISLIFGPCMWKKYKHKMNKFIKEFPDGLNEIERYFLERFIYLEGLQPA